MKQLTVLPVVLVNTEIRMTGNMASDQLEATADKFTSLGRLTYRQQSN
jgi:hypothetical protein